ncbi:MAG TPA: TetR/AcrR family transcriptional regulator [Albitalea sp.]|nr:TetR/AcrR family transcriptional regulator [Albitalea sp.]
MTRTPATAPKRQYHHGDLKNALQAAASALIAERGAESVSLREISQAAGVSHAAAYRHYADKQALLADLAQAGFSALADINRRTVASSRGGPVEQLQACGRAYVEFGVRQPHLLQLMFGGVIADWQSHPGLAQASADLADTLAQVVNAGQASGELRTGDVGDLTLTAWSLVHGLALLIVGQRIPGVAVDARFVKHAARRCTALLIDGLRKR